MFRKLFKKRKLKKMLEIPKWKAGQFYVMPKPIDKAYIVISSEMDDHEIVGAYKNEDDAKNKASENEDFEYYEYVVE